MVKKTQTAKNALHVSKNYAYLKPSVLRSMANDISGTRLEACKSYAVSRLPKIAVTATLASLLACGAGLPTHQAWANGFNLPDGSYRYANRDSSTKAQRYVDIKLVPCDEKQNDNKDTADKKTYGQYYKVEYQFNSNGDWWGGRPFWWASVPKGVEIVNGKVNLYKHEQLTGDSSSQQTGATYTKESWNQSASRFWFSKNTEKTEFENNWKRMTGEAGGYNNSGDTYNTSTAYMKDTSALIINWESRGNRKSKISFVIKLNAKEEPLKFAAGVYQVMGNWHYTVGKVELAPTLPEYSEELELNYPQATEIATFGQPTKSERDKILSKLWDANKSNTDVLKKLKGMEQTQTEEAFKKAITINDDGSAKVTYKDNSTDTISKENLTKRYVPLADRTKITYPALTPVKNLSSLNPTEKTQVEDAVKNANKDKNIKSVTVDANGKATITFDDKIGTPSTKTIEGKYLVKKQRSLADKFTPYYPVPMAVGNPAQLTQGEQTELVNKVYEANKTKADFMNAIGNPSSAADAKTKNIITVDTQGNVTITYTDKSTDKLDGSKMVYQAKKLNETTYITLPARTAVDNAKSLKDEDQKKVRQAILEANSGLKSKLKDNNESAITFDDNTHTMTVKFNDGSTSTFDYSELVYTKGNPEKPTMQNASRNGYKYNITKIAVKDKSKLTPDDWHKFVRKFVQDNWEANQGQTAITDEFINGTSGLLDKLNATGDNKGNGMQLYNYKDKWHTKSDSNLTLSNGNFGQNGIVSIYQGSSIEIKKNGNFGQETAFMLSADDCFVSDSAAPKPEELKNEANDLIDKILKKNGLNDQEIKKFKEDHKNDINNIAKPGDVDNIIKSADEHGKDEKKKKDAQKQIENATSSLDEKTKQELKNKLKGKTDPDEINRIVNEAKNKKSDEDQKQKNDQQAKEEEQQKQAVQTQQATDNSTVDKKQQQATQEENTSNQQAEKDKKDAELEKKKQAAIDEIRNGEDYKNLTPGDKKQFIENIQNAADENDINTIKQQAAEKATQNQNAADNSNKEGLDKAKTDAKKKIGELTNLNARDKQKYQGDIDSAKDLDSVETILDNANTADAKAAAKKKIAELKQKGDLTEDEANGLIGRIDSAKDLREVEGILEEAELKKAKKDAKSEVDKLTNLNKAQKDALKAEIDDIETDPTSNKLKTVDQAKTAITDVVTKAKELDKKMGDLKALVDLVKKQEEDLKKSEKYNDTSKKTAFDSALTNASTLVDTAKGTNADGTKVDNIKKALEQAVQDLGGKTVDKSKLQTEIETAYELQGKNNQGQDDSSKKKNPKYENASEEKKNDFDNALHDAKQVYDQRDASQQSINDAESKLSKAIDALDGHNKSDLNDAIKKANSKKSEIAYKNASKDKKSAFDRALNNAETIEKKAGASETEISDAKDKLDNAISALNGTVDTSKLQAEVNKADALKKSVQYTNAVQDKKSAFDAALQQAESSLTEANNNQSQKSPEEKQKAVNDALQQLQTAAAALNGVDIADLQAEIALENRVKESVKYVYDTAEKQQAYNKALQDAKELVSKLAGSGDESKDLAGKSQSERQALVDSSLKNLKNAKDALNGVNKTVLQAEVDDDSRFSKSLEYSLGEPNDLDVYKKALAEAKRVLADPNATQAQVDSALKDLQAAKNSIANKYSGAGGGNIGSGAGTDNAGTGSEAGYGVNDNAPTTVDKSELDIQIDSAESDSQPGNAGNGNAGANSGAKSGNAGNAANNNAGFNDANGANSAAVNAAVENNQAVKQADVQVSKAQATVNTALAEAKRVLADPNATQAQVDAAVRNLSMARKALADAKSNAAKVRASVRSKVLKSGRADQLSNTGSNVSVFGLLAATISAAGAALLGSRRRGAYRHSNK